MEIHDSFLEPEVRDGFYVPSTVKQAWAAELEVLAEIDRICKKYEIAYFADWGTLLGAVRHKGFIPWDDDLDITMKRADYERFLQVAEQELPEGFSVFTYEKHPDFWSFMARVVAKSRICFEEEHLRKFHGFPYIVGIDVFVLDYVSVDEAKNDERNKLVRYAIAVADAIAEGRLVGAEKKRTLDEIEQIYQVLLDDREDISALRVKLYRVAENLFAAFSEKESKYLTRMMPDELYRDRKFWLPKEYYDKQIWLPFENTLLPVPSGYDAMLRKRYGDYMKLVRNNSGHNYPFFETQKKQLQAVLDFDMPGYRYKGVVERKLAEGRAKSLKCLVEQIYTQLSECVKALQTVTRQCGGDVETDIALLQECQQLAIDMGTLIENCKGEGHSTVSVLETFCEVVYGLSQGCTPELLDELDNTLANLEKSIQKNILQRKEVVFLPYKASQWKCLQSVWESAVKDEMCDVYVVPIPYFYKEYDGELRDMQYEAEYFPKNVQVIDYESFDFELHYPDVIFIQNPYDEFNEAISVHRYFYSSNLVNLTEQLVYIPPFVVEEFSKGSERAYHNMQHYGTVPGVVNADKVIVQSENMKQLYVDKLTEFAGADTRKTWEEKILGLGSPLVDVMQSSEVGNAEFPAEWKCSIERLDGSRKKVILYHTGLSSFVQYGDNMLEKMRRVFDIFAEQRESVVMIWKPHSLIKTTLEQTDLQLYQKYIALQHEYLEREIGILDETEEDARVAAICDAYFGDASALVQLFRNEGKPVMLQDVEV